MVSPTKPDEGHVLFWITEEDGREFATCAAAAFRAAMTERDELRAEIETLRLGLKVGDQRYAELGTENERLRAEATKHALEYHCIHKSALPHSYDQAD